MFWTDALYRVLHEGTSVTKVSPFLEHVARAGSIPIPITVVSLDMSDNEHGRDVTLANEKDEESDVEDKEEAEQEVEEAAREQRQKERMEEVERESDVREQEAEEQENIDNHRDEPPFDG